MWKQCTKCKRYKAYYMFSPSKGGFLGLVSHCKSCRAKDTKIRMSDPVLRAKYSKRKIDQQKNHQWYLNRCKTPRFRAQQLLRYAKRRALKNGLPMDLNLDWVYERVIKGRCEYTGCRFDFNKAEHSYSNPMTPSIDRIDSSKGYTKDNCQVVIWAYNLLKSDWGAEAAGKMAVIIAEAYLKKVTG